VKAVANFAAAVVAYGEKLKKIKGIETNSNEPYLREMVPLIGERKLRELTQSDLDELAKSMRPGASLETLKRHVYTPFMAAYNAAVQRDPPLADPKHWAAPKGKKRKGNCPDDAYISKLVDAADIHERRGKRKNVVTGSRKPERDKAVVLFLTFTGARSGEAQRLALRDVFLERGYAMLRRTKNGNPRQVALTPDLIDALRAQITSLSVRGLVSPDTLVFECETRWGIPQLVKRARERAGLQHYRPHQIGRHAFATRLLDAGESTTLVKDAGGWSDTRMIDDYYGHLAQERTDRVVAGAVLKTHTQSSPNIDDVAEKPNNSVA
jgi:integrase